MEFMKQEIKEYWKTTWWNLNGAGGEKGKLKWKWNEVRSIHKNQPYFYILAAEK